MTKENLDNLVRIGQLHAEPANVKEFAGLVKSAQDRLQDVSNTPLTIASRFDLTYNAAHSLALAALRWHGYRSDNRFQVFQCLGHTLNVSSAEIQVFNLCHNQRNLAEYQGHLEIDEKLLVEFIQLTNDLMKRVNALAPIK